VDDGGYIAYAISSYLNSSHRGNMQAFERKAKGEQVGAKQTHSKAQE